MTYYAYIIDSNENDYVTTSYNVREVTDWVDISSKFNSIYKDDVSLWSISVFSFNQEDVSGYEYVVIDTTMSDSFFGFGSYAPPGETYIKLFFKIVKKEHDKQRGTLDLFVRRCEEFDLLSYRRDNRIRKVIGNIL